MKTQIRNGYSAEIRPNFTEEELRCRSIDAPDSFYIQDDVLDALQYIRDYVDAPLIPTSTGRTYLHQIAIGSAMSSQHFITDSRPVRAIDFSASTATLDEIKEQIRNKGHLWQELRARFGVSMGLYRSFVHIDTGYGAGVNSANVFSDGFGPYGFWDKEKKSLHIPFLDSDTDGIEAADRRWWIVPGLIVAAVLYSMIK